MDQNTNPAPDAEKQMPDAPAQLAPAPDPVMLKELEALRADKAALEAERDQNAAKAAALAAERDEFKGAAESAVARAQAAAAPKATEDLWYVIDSSATADAPTRTHEQRIDGTIHRFTFAHGRPLGMPKVAAIKFLKNEGFKRTDETGKIIDHARRPKQPDELGAGERFKLADDQTIARYDELSNSALYTRALELPGGEQFAKADVRPDRNALIAFIVEATLAMKAANLGQPDNGSDDWVPPAIEDEAA